MRPESRFSHHTASVGIKEVFWISQLNVFDAGVKICWCLVLEVNEAVFDHDIGDKAYLSTQLSRELELSIQIIALAC